MTTYQEQVHCAPADIDLDFWRAPEGVSVPDDELAFLLVPDAVEALAVGEVARDVHAFQRVASDPISAALMATMGGMLPGILLYDHLVHGRPARGPCIDFGTIGISLYKGPGERYDEPRVQQAASIPIDDRVVLVIDDLGDRGGTMQFLRAHLAGAGAREVLTLLLYMKPAASAACPADFHFGEVAQDTWIITPREMVETMAKRIPVWRERGADSAECRRRLIDVIGYPAWLVERYLATAFGQA